MKSVYLLSVFIIVLVACGTCGGGDASGSESTPSSGAAGPVGSGEPSAGGDGANGGSAGGGGGAGAGGTAGKTKQVSPAQEEAEERTAYERGRYGPPSRRSSVFRRSARQGTLKHIPEFGDEAKESERDQAQATLTAYLAAAGEGQWDQACKYLLPYYASLIEKSAAAAAGSPRSCPEALQVSYERAAAEPGPRFPDGQVPQVASFRVTLYPPNRAAKLGVEKAGFALLHGSDGEDYYASMTREGGRWLLTAPLPHPLG